MDIHRFVLDRIKWSTILSQKAKRVNEHTSRLYAPPLNNAIDRFENDKKTDAYIHFLEIQYLEALDVIKKIRVRTIVSIVLDTILVLIVIYVLFVR